MMRSLPFVWPYALVFWAVFLWAFTPESLLVFRSARPKAPRPSSDAGSMLLILVGQQLAMLVGFLAPWVFSRASWAAHRVMTFWIGVALLAAGSLLRRHCFRVLGTYFTGAVVVQTDHQVVDRGAYRWVRHPSYTAGMIMFLGIGLAMGNWISVAVLVIIPMAVYSYRVTVEERALLEQIGEPYRTFMRGRKRFIPFVV
jgi:protein-S-isoprenylcysteine O-methyltransferase Ste14